MSTLWNSRFVFPVADLTVHPDLSLLFALDLLSSPLPKNSFFQNFTLKKGDVPEYIHPYLVKLSLSYPSRFSDQARLYQVYTADLTVSVTDSNSRGRHVISSYSDLGVNLDFPSSNLSFFLARGSPYLTFSVLKPTSFSISTVHVVVDFCSSSSLTKHTVKLNNNKIWIIYTSSPTNFSRNRSAITSDVYAGIVRN